MKHLKKWITLSLVLTLLFSLLALPTSAASKQKDKLKVMVLSDIHVLESDLIADNKAYQDAMAKNLKMFNESEAIFNQEIKRVEEEKPDVLLLSGDLTKDGELESHKSVAAKLNALKKKMPKLKIYVTPGNHDIRNEDAYNYTAKKDATRTEPEDFRKVYAVSYQDDSVIARISRAPERQTGFPMLPVLTTDTPLFPWIPAVILPIIPNPEKTSMRPEDIFPMSAGSGFWSRLPPPKSAEIPLSA